MTHSGGFRARIRSTSVTLEMRFFPRYFIHPGFSGEARIAPERHPPDVPDTLPIPKDHDVHHLAPPGSWFSLLRTCVATSQYVKNIVFPRCSVRNEHARPNHVDPSADILRSITRSAHFRGYAQLMGSKGAEFLRGDLGGGIVIGRFFVTDGRVLTAACSGGAFPGIAPSCISLSRLPC